jgi:sugar lactone lactonase YvrE
MRPLLLTLLALIMGASALPAAPRHALLLREAGAAAQQGDMPAALAKLEEAATLRPDYPRIQLNLARVYTALNRPGDALAALNRVAAMGLQMNVEADPGLVALKESPEFQAVAARLSAGPAVPAPTDATSFLLSDITGIIESCLLDPVTLEWYFGDVRNRRVWRLEAGSGSLKPFTHDDDRLDGVFKIALSPDRKTLWAATASLGVMTGPDNEDGKRSALVAIDFATGRVRDRFPVPGDGHKHLLGDFVLASDGSLYATDSFSPVIWHLAAGGTALEPWLQSDEFLSLQGIAFSADAQSLYVADYANGIWRVDPATKAVSLLVAPAHATFFGIDGLYTVPDGILAVQNGVNPQRVLHITPAASGASTTRVFALGQPAMDDLALGHVANGRFHFVGNSGWALFDPPPESPPAPRDVVIYSVPAE